MRHLLISRSATSALAAALLLVAVFVANAVVASDEHPVVGRWVVEAEPGGAVWAFQPSGALVATGPGEIISKGAWTPADGPGEFDAQLAVEASGQELEILGQVSEDGVAIALYVTATEATKPDDWTPWPAESRLTGHPLGMMTEETPQPTQPPVDCLRPLWVEGTVDWDRCDEAAGTP